MTSAYLASKYGVDRAQRAPAPIDNSGAMSSVWAQILGLSEPTKVVVDDCSVRGLPALDRAKNLVVQSVATMLVEATVKDPAGVATEKPAVIARPHPLMQPFEFYEQAVDVAIMHGNYVAIIVGESDAAQLVPVPLGAVSLDSSSGFPMYTIGNRVYSWREIFHVRAFAPIGTWWGMGVVERYRRSLSEHLHGQAYGEASFRSGSVPSLSVQLDVDTPSEEQVTATKTGFMDKFGGGVREPIVHGRAMTIEPLSWSPHDAEFIEARKISLAEAALMVGLRPEDIGASLGSSNGYANRTDDALQRITDGYGPWMRRVEGPLSDLLLDGRTVAGNPEALLRTSTKERLEIRKLAQEIGVETREESRAEEGRPPVETDEQTTTETEEVDE